MRIVAGEHRSRRLAVPAGAGVRPTSDRAREAIFASLGSRIVDARVLDLFAGSGAMGLEALSRGAASCRFVERDGQALGVIRENIRTLGVEDRATVEKGSALTVLRRLVAAGERYDVIVVDPPYDAVAELAPRLGTLLPEALADDGRIVIETGRRDEIPLPGLVARYDRRIAAARIVILGPA